MRYLILFVIIGFLIYILFRTGNYSGDDINDSYNKKVFINNEIEDFQKEIYQSLSRLNLSINDSLELSVNELTNKDIDKITLIDVYELDYSNPCKEISNVHLLKGRDYCQFGILQAKSNETLILRGWCNNDLMNLSKSFHKVRFNLEYPIEILRGEDKLKITKDIRIDSSIYFWIEPKVHEKFVTSCKNTK